MGLTEILVGCVELDDTDPAENAAIVSAAERRRAALYRHRVDSRRFLARRATTRRILAEALDKPVGSIRICHGPFGKPYLADSPVQFSTSHSKDLLLIAIAPDREVGCDIEHRDETVDLALLAPMTFSESEFPGFAAIHDDLKIDAFYDRWTCKEAYLKALGTGLSISMTDFAIVPAPFRIVTVQGVSDDWSARAWGPKPAFRATVVARGKDWCIRDRGSPARDRPSCIHPTSQTALPFTPSKPTTSPVKNRFTV